MPTTDGTNFWRQDTDLADTAASSLQDQNMANNIRYLRKRDAAVAWAPNNTAEIGSLDWSSVFSVLLHIPARTTTIRLGCVTEVDIDAASPDTTGRVATQGVVTLPSPDGGERGDVQTHDITGTDLTQIEHEVDLAQELEDSVFGNLRFDQKGFIKEQGEEAATVTSDVVQIDDLWWSHTGSHSTSGKEVLRVNRDGGDNDNQPRGDILQALGGSNPTGRALIGSTGAAKEYTFIHLPYLRPHFFYVEFDLERPPHLKDAAMTHRIPYAAQHSVFPMAREIQKGFNRRRVVAPQSGPADDWDWVSASGTITGTSGTIVDQTGVPDRSTDSSDNSRLEVALGLVLAHRVSNYTPNLGPAPADTSAATESDALDTLAGVAGRGDIKLEASLEQLGKGEDWSTATTLGSTTDVVPMTAWPTPLTRSFPLLVQVHPKIGVLNALHRGQMYRSDFHLLSPEIVSIEVDESSWVLGDPVRLTVDATFDSWTPSEVGPDEDSAILVCPQVSTHWAVQ